MALFNTKKKEAYTSEKESLEKVFNILIVDDEPENLLVLDGLLSRKYNIFSADSGAAARDIIFAQNIHLVITDQRMPEMTGVQFLFSIKNDHPDTIRIILTGYTDVEDIIYAINECDIYSYVTKPWNENELLLTIDRALDKFALESENKTLLVTLSRNNQHLVEINEAISRFVPKPLLKALGKPNVVDVKRGDHLNQNMSVMFSDISKFTGLTEKMTPQEVFDFTNNYHERISPIVSENNGFVQQLQGDGAISLFIDSPLDALKAAISTQNVIAEYSQTRIEKNRRPIQMSIGIHTGAVLLGIIGDEHRWESGIPSDTVIKASRIEGLCKYYKVSIILGDEAFNQIDSMNDFNYRYLDKVQVLGKCVPISVYEIFDTDPAELKEKKAQTKSVFSQGQDSYFKGDFADAIKCFAEVLGELPTDVPSKLFLDRSSNCLSHGVPDDWDGVWCMDNK